MANRFAALVALVTAILAAVLALYGANAHPGYVSDLDQSLYAARALVRGANP